MIPMLLCQVEMRSLNPADQEPAYYVVGRYGFDPGLQEREEVWVNWQVFDQKFEIRTRVVSRRKEVYVDGKSIVLQMSDIDKTKFLAIHPNGIDALLEGASLFLLRIFVEAEDREQLLRIQEAIARGEKRLGSQGPFPKLGA